MQIPWGGNGSVGSKDRNKAWGLNPAPRGGGNTIRLDLQMGPVPAGPWGPWQRRGVLFGSSGKPLEGFK